MLISIITPCYNEEDNILDCINRVAKVFKNELKSYEYEHIFIDNFSEDDSFNILSKQSHNNKNLKVLRNSRNVGAFKSMFTALSHTSGDIILIQLPADMQDPPEVIPQLIETMENQNIEIVYGVRKNRNENFITTFYRNLFYSLINKFSNLNLPNGAGEFCLVSRKVANILIATNDKEPFLRTMIRQTGYEAAFVDFNWQKRKKGKSKVNFAKNFDIAINAFISVSKRPTRFVTILGFSVSLISLVYGLVTLVLNLLYPSTSSPGIPTLIVFLFFFSGIQFLILGIIGEYVFSTHRYVRSEVEHQITDKINFN
jgi:polyisoprenyl-phosphate glycosyltransferase